MPGLGEAVELCESEVRPCERKKGKPYEREESLEGNEKEKVLVSLFL